MIIFFIGIGVGYVIVNSIIIYDICKIEDGTRENL